MLAGINGKEVRAENVKVLSCGTEFTLIIGKRRRFVKTKLLGRHNATNICLSAAAAFALGVSPERIFAAVGALSPPEHRLKPLAAENGITVIDDGYNANICGVKSAAEVLKEIGGKKFAVFSGIAEGGDYAKELNEEAGEALKDSVDVLIAVGVYAGYVSRGAEGGKCKIYEAKDLSFAKEILKTLLTSGDTVIFINDLPDKY